MRTEQEKRDFISAGTDHRNLMVEAGAGAGKTHLLVDRILNQIENNVCEIQEIVAITFTRKAATEMKERLQRVLMDRIGKSPESSALKKAIENIHRMQISTIHSFCGEMIRSRPCDCDAGMEYDLLEAEDFEAVLMNFERSFLSEDHVGDRELAKWVSDLSLYPNLKKDFDRVLLNEGLDFRLPSKTELPSMLAEFQTSGRAIYDSLVGLLRFGQTEKLSWRKNVEESAKEAVAIFESYQKRRSSRDFMSFLSTVEKMLKAGLSSSKSKLSELKKASLLTSKNGERAYDLEAEVLQSIQNCWEKRDGTEYAICVWALQDFKAYYVKNNLSGSTALSNSELLYYAMRIAEKEEARSFFQRKYRRFYIDEFQDTDPLQAKLFLSLSCENSGDLHKVSMEELRMLPGRLFVVGDPKQSIYRFRGADLNVYNRVKAIFLSQETAEVIQLDKTFRYHKGLGDEVTSIFSRSKEDCYGFGKGSPSGIEFRAIETNRNYPPAEIFQGLYVVQSDHPFIDLLEDYLLRIKRELQKNSSNAVVQTIYDVYEAELKETLASAYLKRMEKSITFEPGEKSGNRFKKEFLEKVSDLLEKVWRGESSDPEEELYPSLQELEEGISECHSFQTLLRLLELRMSEESTVTGEVEFLLKLESIKDTEAFKSLTSEDKKTSLLQDLKDGMISEIPEAVRRTVLQLLETKSLAADKNSNLSSTPIHLRDILILTRQKEMLSKIGGVLREAGIPYHSTEQRGFEEYASIRTLLKVAEFIENFSMDRLLRLLSASFGWNSRELREFQQEVKFQKESLMNVDDDRSPRFLAEHLKQAAKNLIQKIPSFYERKKELDILFQLLRFDSEKENVTVAMQPLGILEAFLLNREVLLYGIDPAGHEAEDEINAAYLFLQMLRDSSPVTAQQVAERMRTLIRRTVEHQFIPDQKEDALRLMNLHKAKGLEGKIVFLVGEADRTEKSGAYFHSESNRAYLEFFEAREKMGNHLNKIDYVNRFIPEEERKEAEEASVLEAKEERIRLDYVAVTRAREAVVVIDPKGCYDSALQKSIHLQRMGAELSNTKHVFTKKTRIPYTPDKREPYEAFGGVFLKTPSDIEALDVSLHGTDRSRPTGAEFGTMVHRVFELMTRAKLEKRTLDLETAMRSSIETFMRENLPTVSLVRLTLMGEVSLEEIQRMDYAERVQCVFEILKKKTMAILEKVWMEKVSPQLNSSCKVYTELPFVLAVEPGSDLAKDMSLKSFDTTPEQFLVRGKMDLVLKKPNGEFLVCDYKTNVMTNAISMEDFRQSLQEKYRYQMKLYTQAIHKLFGVSVERVHSMIIDLY